MVVRQKVAHREPQSRTGKRCIYPPIFPDAADDCIIACSQSEGHRSNTNPALMS